MCHCTAGLININNLNNITTILTVAHNKSPCIGTFAFLYTCRNKWTEDTCSIREVFDWYVSRKKVDNLFLSYFTNKASLHICLWGPLIASPILFGVIGFYGRITSICETTGMTWSNLDQIYSKYVLWYLLLIKILILTLYSPHWVLCFWISSSLTCSVMVSSQFIATISTFFLYCVGSWWLAGEFGILSMTECIVKYSSSNKLKPILFPEEGKSISYVRIFVSQNGV